MSARLPGALALRAWMERVRLWAHGGVLPPIPHLVIADRFAREDARGDLARAAALLALRAAWDRPVHALPFELFAERGAAWFEGSPSERRQLFSAFDAFRAWWAYRGQGATPTSHS